MPKLSAFLEQAPGATAATPAPAAAVKPAAAAAVGGGVPDPRGWTGKPPVKQYRQPDGTLGPNKPPLNPYAVAARKNWEDLVAYCRVNGGCKECEGGKCYLHHHGVSYEDHAAYLAKMGRVPEKDSAGNWIGFDPKRVNPLADPAHPFSKYDHAVYYPNDPPMPVPATPAGV